MGRKDQEQRRSGNPIRIVAAIQHLFSTDLTELDELRSPSARDFRVTPFRALVQTSRSVRRYLLSPCAQTVERNENDSTD